MNKYDFYKEFIKSNEIKLGEVVQDLHDLYSLRYKIYSRVEQYREPLIEIGFDFEAMDKMLHDEHYYKNLIHTRIRKLIPKDIVSDVYAFMKTYHTLIKLKHEIRITALCCRMPDKMYFRFQYSFNREIANNILRGGYYNFGQRLSSLGICYVLRSEKAKPVVDWGESNKLKKRLIEEGYVPKSEENPNGVSWVLYRTDEGYCFWRWLKATAVVPNKRMYRFRAIATNNESTDYGGKLTQEEILEKNIGPFDKMMALLKLNPLIKEKYDFGIPKQ
jgi:hypothetical protein